MTSAALHVRDLVADDWPAAAGVAARAMCHEPFMVAILGEDQLARVGEAARMYRAWPWSDDIVATGAFVVDELVGMAVASPPPTCRLCERIDSGRRPPDDVVGRRMHEFDVAARAAHQGQPPHSRVAPVAVEPVAQGAGVGAAVVGALVQRLDALGGGTVLLECLPKLESFYGAAGFRTVGSFVDPYGPDVLLMRADLPTR